jgi:hypothetical protein
MITNKNTAEIATAQNAGDIKMTKQKFSIALWNGFRREVDGYAFEMHGICFGVAKRPIAPTRSARWIATELETGRTVGTGHGRTRKKAIELLEERFEQMTRRITLEEAVKQIRDAVKTCGRVEEMPLEEGGEG